MKLLCAIILASLLAGCDYKVDSSTHIFLKKEQWVCTRERIVSTTQYGGVFTECVEYRRLA